uniref:Uncharacterized protein n=1 Tax=Oryza brachyantha TaxID=4533 RepID=J3M866_ORYBR
MLRFSPSQLDTNGGAVAAPASSGSTASSCTAGAARSTMITTELRSIRLTRAVVAVAGGGRTPAPVRSTS